MLTYRNEAAFSKALVTALRNKKWFVQRIESGQMGKGIPDIFAISPSHIPMWLELKREHSFCNAGNYVEIHWRPGQQAWLTDVNQRGMLTYTIACFNDGILQIPHKHVYIQNLIPVKAPDIHFYKSIKELLA
jgi:hypothetical protein